MALMVCSTMCLAFSLYLFLLGSEGLLLFLSACVNTLNSWKGEGESGSKAFTHFGVVRSSLVGLLKLAKVALVMYNIK